MPALLCRTRFHGMLIALLPLLVLMGACNENFRSRGGCETDDDCLAPRVCQAGLCVDIGGVDAGIGDVELDGSGMDVVMPPGEVDPPDIPPDEGRLVVTPVNFDFGPIEFGVTEFVGVRLQNVGSAPLEVDEVRFGAADQSWSLDASAAVGEIDPGEIRIATVSFTPTIAGPSEALLEVIWNLTIEEVVLTAEAVVDPVGEDCSAWESSLVVLPEVDVFDETRGAAVLFNCGETDLLPFSIDGANPGPFLYSFGPDPLPPGTSRELEVSAEWDEAGSYESTVRLLFQSGHVSPPVTLRALFRDPVEPSICVRAEPSLLDFGSLTVGETSTSQFAVVNCGEADLRLDTLSFERGMMFESVGEPGAVVLAPGAAAPVLIEFAPSLPGLWDDAVLVTFEPSSNVSVGLRGLAAAPAVGPVIDVAPELVEFGEVAQGGSAFANLTVCNEGDATLVVDGVEQVEGDPTFETDGDVVFDLPPGECRNLGIVFSPQGVRPGGAREFFGRFEVVSNALDGDPSFGVFGFGFADDDPDTCFEPLNEGEIVTVAAGSEAEASLLWINCGAETVFVEDIGFALDGPFPAGFDVVEVSDDIIGPGGVLEIVVSFGATRAGIYEGFVELETNAGRTEQFVLFDVFNEGGEACIEVEPGSLNFGTLEVGEGDAREVEVSNCGESTLNIASVRLQSGRRGFSVRSGGFALPPGASRDVIVQFSQDDEGTFRDTLRITTDADDIGVVSVPVQAVVTDATFCPTLRAGGATSEGSPFLSEVTALEGDDVFLDAGYPVPGAPGVEFEWELVEFEGVRPPDVEDTVVNGRILLTQTFVGTYIYSVTYESVDGCAGSDIVAVQIDEDTGVGEGIRVVISWRTPGDPDEFDDPGSDVDLHVSRRVDGRSNWNGRDDCYYANREAEWGDADSVLDNGRLLRDEVDGIGPEIFVLEQPARGETWLVAVHYFSDDGLGPSDVTLRIFRNGIQQVSSVRTLEDGGDVWLAAEISDQGREIELLDGGNFRGFPPATAP